MAAYPRMSTEDILKYGDRSVGKDNAKLLAIAKKVLNAELKPHWKINMRDEILAMKEKERLGFNFNRQVRSSLRSRWDVVDKTETDFLQDIVYMNDQVEEDFRKHKLNLMSLIYSRTSNLTSNSRVEQMAGLFMHLEFYKKILEAKIEQYEPCKDFMMKGCELMGYGRPSQVMERYEALKNVFKELYNDYECRQNKLKKFQEKLNEIKSQTNHRNMLMHNTMGSLSEKLKYAKMKNAYLEIALNEQMENATETGMTTYHIKNSIFQAYSTIMIYRGFEPTETNPFVQLDVLEKRMLNTLAVVHFIQNNAVSGRPISGRRRRERKKLSFKFHSDEASQSSSKSDNSGRSPDFNYNKSNRFPDWNRNRCGGMFRQRPRLPSLTPPPQLSTYSPLPQTHKLRALPPIYEKKLLRKVAGPGRKVTRSINKVKAAAASKTKLTSNDYDRALDRLGLNAMNEKGSCLMGWSSQDEDHDSDLDNHETAELGVSKKGSSGGLSLSEKITFRECLEDLTRRQPDTNWNKKLSDDALQMTVETPGDCDGQTEICEEEEGLHNSQDKTASVKTSQTTGIRGRRLPKLPHVQQQKKISTNGPSANKTLFKSSAKHVTERQRDKLMRSKDKRKRTNRIGQNVLKCLDSSNDGGMSGLSEKIQLDKYKSHQMTQNAPNKENEFDETEKRRRDKFPSSTHLPSKITAEQKSEVATGRVQITYKTKQDGWNDGPGKHRHRMQERNYIKNNFLSILADVKIRKTPLSQD